MAAVESEKHGAPSPSRQVTEFKDTYGPFGLYLDGPDIEDDDPDFDVTRFRDSDDEEEDTNHVENPRQALITHIRQVRQSCGFDVDVVVPSWAIVYYFPVDLSDPISRESMTEGAKVAIDGINHDMVKGKIYELVDVVKAVYCRGMSKYLTITAKKLDEEGEVVTIQAIVNVYPGNQGSELEYWRFKPSN